MLGWLLNAKNTYFMNSDYQTIVLTVLALVNIVSIGFFINERKSKNRVITDLKELMDTTDIKRLAKYYKSLDALREKRVIEETHQTVSNWLQKIDKTFINQFDELASFASTLVEVCSSDEQKLHIIRLNFPSCLPLFEKFLSSADNKETEAGNNE